MKIIYHGESSPLELLNGKTYEVLSIEGDWYRVVDETGEDYLYPPEVFDILEDDGTTPRYTIEEAAALRFDGE